MHRVNKLAAPLLLVLSGIISSACVDKSAQETVHRSVETIADEYLATMLETFPEYGTYYGIANARHDALSDNSLAAQEDWQALEDNWLAELVVIGTPADIGSRDWVTYGILREELESSVGRRICRSELWSASTATSWYTGLPFVFDLQPLDSADLKGQALNRLAQVAPFIETEITNLRIGLELGYSAPRVTVVGVPDEARALLGDDNPFTRMGTRADDAQFESSVRQIFEEEVAPAIERFATFIETEYLDRAREDIALTANPDGAQCYPALVRGFATVSPAADEIHQLGLSQNDMIRVEIQAIIDEHFGGGEVATFLRRMNNDPEFTFESEEAVLDYAVAALEVARPRMKEVFNLLPKADVEIKPYPPYRASGVGEYHSSSEDGSRPGIFYIPVTQPEKRPRADQQSFLFHETLPGHHLEQAITLELGDRVHTLARYLGNSGYSEGWGLYAERLADEMGLYSGPLDRIGMLASQGTRAARLVVDTGLHTKGWTRQQAVDYMLANSAWAEADIQSDVNRYISWPGQANSYMLGMLEIWRLRTLAQEALGDDFDIREFHDRVLENGGVTLPMLDQNIMAWIEGN